MTPLEIHMIIDWYCFGKLKSDTIVVDSPAVQQALRMFAKREIIIPKENGEILIDKEALELYMSTITQVSLPMKVWQIK